MFGYKKQVSLSYEQTVSRAREELLKEGFGVLTEVDVKVTLKKKLNADFDDYIILGACNPPFAYQALQTTRDAGLMMPCNLIVYAEKGKTYIACVTPSALMDLFQNAALKPVAEKIEEKLKKVVDSIT